MSFELIGLSKDNTWASIFWSFDWIFIPNVLNPQCTELHHCTVTRITIKRIRWSLILPILENFMNVHDSCYRNDDRCNHWWAFSTRSIAKIVSASGYFHFNSLLISHYRNQIRLLLLWDWTYVKTHSENVTQVHSFIIENQNNTPVHSIRVRWTRDTLERARFSGKTDLFKWVYTE